MRDSCKSLSCKGICSSLDNIKDKHEKFICSIAPGSAFFI